MSEEEIIKECNKLFVTMANVHIDGKPMADLLKLYGDKKEEIYSIARANYILGQTDERSEWFKKINKEIEELDEELETMKVDNMYGRYKDYGGKRKFEEMFTYKYARKDALQELIGKEE